MPHQCVKPTTTYEYLQIPNYSDTFTLYRKAITGPGLTAMTWDYEYQGGHGLAFASNCTTPGSLLCPSVRKVTITGSAPVNTWEQHEYGILYGVDEGQLLSRKIGPTSASVLQTTTNTYMTSAEVASQPFPDLVGENPPLFSDQLGNRLRPLKRRVINQQGVDFIRETTDFDAFGASESDTVTGTATRTEATEYVHDLPRWIIGLPARHLVGGIETDRTVFDSLSRPWKRYRFGALESTFAYDTHGSLASVTDARGYTTTLSGWKWGIPQAIQVPIAGEALGVTVDHRGWITSVTDENGDTTGYGYDAMGRVATVTPPAGTGITFNPTTTAFVAVPSSEMGLTAGHWRQTTSRGDYRKITYFDALWRPVITHEYDAANQTDTQRFAGFRYDHGGRTTFAGNPRASATSIASFTAGTTTSNDALGRPTLVTQSSEHGNLSTTYAYLAGFQTRVTNPRTHSTLTAYQAFDTPGTDSPAEIIAAEGESEEQITTIVRDVFGKALSVTRAGEYAGAGDADPAVRLRPTAASLQTVRSGGRASRFRV